MSGPIHDERSHHNSDRIITVKAAIRNILKLLDSRRMFTRRMPGGTDIRRSKMIYFTFIRNTYFKEARCESSDFKEKSTPNREAISVVGGRSPEKTDEERKVQGARCY